MMYVYTCVGIFMDGLLNLAGIFITPGMLSVSYSGQIGSIAISRVSRFSNACYFVS